MTPAERADMPGSEIYREPLTRTAYEANVTSLVMGALFAAAHGADQRDPLTAEREIPAGSDVCHTCNGELDENDLWHAGPDGDGEPTCARCVMSGDLYYNKLRVLAREAAAVLACSHQTTSARRLAAKIQNLLDGE